MSSFEKVTPTMKNYFALKKKLSFTERGEKLLDLKREQLLQLIRTGKRQFENVKKEMIKATQQAFDNLNKTYIHQGKENTTLIAEILKSEPVGRVTVGYSSRMGIDLPNIKFHPSEKKKLPPYSFAGTSIYLDLTIAAFRNALEKILKYAEVESLLHGCAWEY
ncbi:MAG: V-type ATP synthase subunit D, partial [Promethearchaeota archaeon]